MAYKTHAASNTALITSLASYNLITSSAVKTAMLAIDRGGFIPESSWRKSAYEDSPMGIGWGATISAPHMHAMALEWLGGSESLGYEEGVSSLRGKRVLDVGSGSGYLTACLGEMVFGSETKSSLASRTSHPSPLDAGSSSSSSKATSGTSKEVAEEGMVVAVEHIQELRDMGLRNMCKRERGRKLIEKGKIQFVVGDGREGWVGDGEGYDAIHVGAAAVTVHNALISQLRSPGRIFIPVQDLKGSSQYIWIIDKDIHGMVTKKRLCGVNYVPLTDKPEL